MQAGPTGNQTANSVMWLYRSTAENNEQAHQNAGLYGPVIVTRKGFAGMDGKPTDVDREFVTVFFVSALLFWLRICCSRRGCGACTCCTQCAMLSLLCAKFCKGSLLDVKHFTKHTNTQWDTRAAAYLVASFSVLDMFV